MTEPQTTSNPLLDAALAYVARGKPVFPCKENGDNPKSPYVSGGFTAATLNPEQVRIWWSRWPRAMIGIPTGRISGWYVLDIDRGEGKVGDESLQELEMELGELPETVMALTGGDGIHMVFGPPECGSEIRNSTGENGWLGKPDLDFRGDGGYIIAPPSLHPSGREYCWEMEHHPDEMEPVPLPKALVELFQKRQNGNGNGNGIAALVESGDAIPAGSRDDTIFRIAAHYRAKSVPYDEALFQLLNFNDARCKPSLPEAQVKAKLESAYGRYAPGPSGPFLEVHGNPLLEAHFTDSGNAQRLIGFAGRDMRFVYAWGCWLIWNGSRWQKAEQGEEKTKAVALLNDCYELGVKISDNDSRQRFLRHIMASEAKARIEAMLDLAQPSLSILPSELDSNLFLFNVENGTLNLQTGKKQDARREDYITKIAPVVFDPKADCPKWEAFISWALEDKEKLIRYLQQGIGYSMTGDVREKAFFMLEGEGDNGKSAFLETVRSMNGDYANAAAFSTFTMRRLDNQAPRDDLAALVGSRLVTASEPEKGLTLSASTVKDVTGRDTIKCRHLFAKQFTYKPQFKIWIGTNHLPEVKDSGNAIWNRIKRIPFHVSMPEKDQIKDLPEKLLEERSGILNWMLAGCLDWQENGLQEPEEVKEATQDYRDKQDQVGRFLLDETYCVLEEFAQVQHKALIASYNDWCKEQGETAMTPTGLRQEMERRYKFDKPANRYRWFGVGLAERGLVARIGG